MNQNETQNSRSKLKSMYSHRVQLQEKLKKLELQMTPFQTQIQVISDKLESLNKKIYRYENGKILISTHAIQRYKERINKEATEADIRIHLLTPEIEKLIRTLGGGLYPVKDGVQIYVEDLTVVTVEVVESKQERDHRKIKYKKK